MAADELADDCWLFLGAGRLVESAVGLVKDEVDGQVVVVNRVGDGLPDRPPLHVGLCGVHPWQRFIVDAVDVATSQQGVLPKPLRVEKVDLARLELRPGERWSDRHQIG
jgi:hypothetical protein